MSSKTYLSPEQLDYLASLAESASGDTMTDEERGRFDMNLNEAELTLTTPDFNQTPSADQKEKLLNLADKLDAISSDLISIMLDLQHPFSTECITATAMRIRTTVGTAAPKRGRPSTYPRIFEFIFWLSQAWKIGAKKPAGTASTTDGNHRTGPFVEFVRSAATAMDPKGKWDERHDLGSTVKKALEDLRGI